MCSFSSDILKFQEIYKKIVYEVPISREEYEFCLSLGFPVKKLNVKVEEYVPS